MDIHIHQVHDACEVHDERLLNQSLTIIVQQFVNIEYRQEL